MTQTVYKWGEAPPELKTRKQLAAEGLRPGRGVKPVARIEWKQGKKWADLFLMSDAVEKRKATPAQQQSWIARQLKACTCPYCGIVLDWRIPKGWDAEDCPSCCKKEAVSRAQEFLAAQPLFLDFETTDLGGFVVEAAIIDVEGKVLFDKRMNPQVPIEEGATAVHGIRDEDVRDLPTFAEHHKTIRELLEGRLVIAYNADFERWVLRKEIARVEARPIKVRWECAMELRWVYNGRPYQRERLGGDHSACGDCLATLQLVRAIAVGRA